MKIAVIGSGTMGNGIAHSFASNGYKVILNDINRKFLDNGIATIEQNLNRFLNKGKINSEDVESTLNNIQSTTNIQDISNVDLVVEAATEDFKIKSSYLAALIRLLTLIVFWQLIHRQFQLIKLLIVLKELKK